MREYQVISKDNQIVDYICGYSVKDALRRNPVYATEDFALAGGWYID